MKKNTRLICMALVLALVLSLAACVSGPATTAPSQNLEGPGTSQSTQPTTGTIPTTILTPPTTQPTQPTEPPVEPEPLVYTLTQDDVDAYYQLLTESEALAIAGEDMDAIEASTDALDDQYEYIGAQYSIAQILYYSNMKDEALVQQHLDCADIYTAANDAYIQMARRVYQSDTPAKDMLFEGWTQEELDQLVAYDPKVAQLQQRNSEIEVEYDAAATDAEKIALYIEMVQNNNEIAQVYGYDNYYSYAYEKVYERDYAMADLENMRTYAREYLAPALTHAFNNFYYYFNSLSADKQQKISNILYNDYDTVSGNYVGRFIEVMPESAQTHFNQMLTLDSLFTSSGNAMAGAFTTAIADRSYCFFGPGYANCFTVVHEAGHYYASRYTDLHSIPMDLAETHSQGYEWLFMCTLEKKLMQDQYDALLSYRKYNDLATILVCLMVDEFEQQVYTTDVSDFTAADFDAIMDSVCQGYMPLDTASEYLADLNAYWRLVVVQQPVYYISYAVSAIAAFDLYTVAADDFEAAVEIYRKLCEEPVEDGGFLANITAAGLAGPFQEAFYQEFVEKLS